MRSISQGKSIQLHSQILIAKVEEEQAKDIFIKIMTFLAKK